VNSVLNVAAYRFVAIADPHALRERLLAQARALALKGTSTLVREKIMKNLSSRAAENLAEEIELLGPRRLSEVEEAQAKVVTEIRTLEQAGKIVIARGSDDAFVE